MSDLNKIFTLHKFNHNNTSFISYIFILFLIDFWNSWNILLPWQMRIRTCAQLRIGRIRLQASSQANRGYKLNKSMWKWYFLVFVLDNKVSSIMNSRLKAEETRWRRTAESNLYIHIHPLDRLVSNLPSLSLSLSILFDNSQTDRHTSY